MSTIPVRKRRPRSEKEIDETIDESFPASDPPSYSRTARFGEPSRSEKTGRADDENAAPDSEQPKEQDQSERKDETS